MNKLKGFFTIHKARFEAYSTGIDINPDKG